MKFSSDRLDNIDKQILDMLLMDSRTPLSHISQEVGISSPAIRVRIKKLIQEGIIKGFSTIIDYKKLGLGLTAFIGLSMDESKCCQEDVFTDLENIPRVLEAHFTNGEEEDILVKVVTENNKGIFAEISSAIGADNATIVDISAHTTPTDTVDFNIVVEVRNLDHLQLLLQHLRQMEHVVAVHRS